MLGESVGPDRASVVLSALGEPSSVSVRLNPEKLKECPFEGSSPVPWSPYGHFLSERPVFTLDPLFHAGCYYVQDSSAMFVGEIFRRAVSSMEGPLSVLDLCAAPGGKTTDISSSLRERFGDGFTLIANEVMKKRYSVLRSNVRAWGDRRVGTVSRDPAGFPGKGLFDVIVADVPCSGEGMFRKDSGAVSDWSEETVAFCAARQRRIISDIWDSLRPGGRLIYSTCTFNRSENDGNVRWISSELGAEVLDFGSFEGVLKTDSGYSLLPGFVRGEGQYAAALRKNGEAARLDADLFAVLGAERPAPEPPAGPFWDLSRDEAVRYLHGDALRLPAGAPTGLLTLTFSGYPLGPAKNLGSRCNNLYPKECRIRMSI